NVTGGPSLDGDELRVLVENPSAAIGELQRFRLQTVGFDSFTLVNETRTPGLTPRIPSLTRGAGGGLQLSIPTAFGYNYTVETVDALGPYPHPWTALDTFFGDGAIKSLVIPDTGPRRFFRLRVE